MSVAEPNAFNARVDRLGQAIETGAHAQQLEWLPALDALAREAEAAGERSAAVRALRLILRCNRDSSRHEDVINIASRGIDLCNAVSFDGDRMQFMLAKSRRLLRLVALESAVQVLADANDLADLLDDPHARAEVALQMGVLHGLSGDLDLAEASFQRAANAFELLEDHASTAEAIGGLAVAKWRRGVVAETRPLYEKAVALSIAAQNWTYAIHASANLSVYFMAEKNFAEADRVLTLAETIFHQQGLLPFSGWILATINRGSYYQDQGHFDKAMVHFDHAVQICNDIHDVILKPLLENEYAKALAQAGDYQGAHQHLKVAYDADMENAVRGRTVELNLLRGAFEVAREQQERALAEASRRELQALVEQRTLALSGEVIERREAEARANRLAYHDPLTGLANRTLFTRMLDAEVIQADSRSGGLAVLFLDLNNFKQINDARGHEKGDRVLCQIAQRLLELEDSSETICRFGGDEFIVLVRQAEFPQRVAERVAQIQRVFAEPFVIGDDRQWVTASIGVSRYPDHSREPAQLIRFADMAMFAAKQHQVTTFVEFDERMRLELVLRSDLQREFHSALAQGEISLVYQPKVRTAAREVTGFEALARWSHPRYGEIAPTRFVPLLEESGLIHELGRWVIRTVCAQMVEWRAGGGEPVCVAVNVSQKQMHDEVLPALIAQTLAEHGLEPGCLEIELTESTVMQEAASVIALLSEISNTGVRIAVDDFGTGYSSLSLLSQLPLDAIKIDQSFVRSMLTNPADRLIVQTIIRMAQGLQLDVTAEGVETEEQAAFLLSEGCDYCQGFLFGPGVTADSVPQRFSGRTTH